MKRKFFRLISLLLLAAGTASAASFSDYYGTASGWLTDPHTGLTSFPLLEIPLGGRAASMGNAYTAVPLDAGAMLANPASTALLPLTQLSFSHNNWLADSSVESAAFTRRFGSWGAGISAQLLHLPFTAYNSFAETTAAARIPEGVLALNASYNFLSSYYFRGISVGANLKGAFRLVSPSLYEDITSESQSLASVMVDLGVITQFNFLKFSPSRDRNVFVGVAVKNLGLPAKGDPLPTLASAGLAYSPIRPLLLSFDFDYPFSLVPDVEAEKWYLSAGANLNVTDFFSVQTGFTYPGANPRFSLGSALDLEEMSILVNYTLDLATQLTTADRFTLEAKMNLGDEGRAGLRDEVDQYFIEGLDSYAAGELERAVEYWQAALLLDPTFQPAREYLDIAEKTLNLYVQMDEMNRIE